MSNQSSSAEPQSKRPLLWGRFSPLVLLIVLIGVALDQGTKIWLVHSFDLANNGPVSVLPVLDLVLVWNRGISYGLFQQNSDVGRWLLAGLTIAVTIGVWIWSARCQSRLVALSLALVIGGAVGNGIDRVFLGAVVDFVYFHAGNFSWYVFNLADVWIVAGVAGLLYDSFRNGPNSAAK
ncbi:signal peptidase II [Roseibium sp. SCP14]|uniref:signal peptidase II n=1 Tax=Roseibium sp. SCP14 TaxID=3141375 RepID=UPI0033361A2B